MSEDGDDGFPLTEAPKDYSGLSMGDLLTRIQRLHVERMLEQLEGGTVNAQVMAQINRYLADNGIIVPPSEQPRVIEGTTTPMRKKLPDYSGRNYNE